MPTLSAHRPPLGDECITCTSGATSVLLKPANFAPASNCVADLGLGALPHRAVDLDRRYWFDVEQMCGQQHDIEGWLRRATTDLELRKIGY